MSFYVQQLSCSCVAQYFGCTTLDPREAIHLHAVLYTRPSFVLGALSITRCKAVKSQTEHRAPPVHRLSNIFLNRVSSAVGYQILTMPTAVRDRY